MFQNGDADYSNGQFRIGLSSAGDIHVQLHSYWGYGGGSKASNMYQKVDNFDVSRYHHFVVTISKRDVSYFLDGVLVSNKSWNLDYKPFDSNYKIQIGRYYNSAAKGYANYFNGIVDEISIYNRILTNSEIQNIFKSSSTNTATLESATEKYNPVQTQTTSKSFDYMLSSNTNCKINCQYCVSTSLTWSGECKNGFGNGQGEVVYYQNKDILATYQGLLKDGYFDGIGIYNVFDRYRRTIEGSFKRGKLYKGIIKYESGVFTDGIRDSTLNLHGQGKRGFKQNWPWGQNTELDAFYEGTFNHGALVNSKILKKMFTDERKEIIPVTWEGSFTGAVNQEVLNGQGEHCYPCTESFILVYNWVKCWERGEFRDGKLYNGMAYEPTKGAYGRTENPDYFNYTNGAKKRVENTSSSSDNSSSTRDVNSTYENMTVKVKDYGEWEKNANYDEWYQEIEYEDETNKVFKSNTGVYFIKLGVWTSQGYLTYNDAVLAAYLYKKYDYILKKNQK